MSFINNLPDQLIPQTVQNQFFAEYQGLTPLSGFMGKYLSPSIIQIRDLNETMGRTAEFPLIKSLNYRIDSENFDQLEGKEKELEFYTDRITINARRDADKLIGVPIVDATTPIRVYNQLKPQLLLSQQKNLIWKLFSAMTSNLYTDYTAQIPVYDRGIFSGLSPNRAGWYGNINAGVDAMVGGVAYNQNGLSVDTLIRAKEMAGLGGVEFEAERKIMPTMIKTKKGFPEEKFAFLCSEKAFNRSLRKDPEWQAQVNRGTVVSEDQPEALSGARYKGTFEGILVYTCPELDEFNITFNGKTASWGLFCGAQAVGLAWSLRPQFKMREWDYDNVGLRVLEYRGQKTLVYPGKINPAQMVENGIIHVFSRIA